MCAPKSTAWSGSSYANVVPVGKFYDATGDPTWGERASPAYVACIGILMSQYTITGFDASAHLSEETRKASWSAPIGVSTYNPESSLARVGRGANTTALPD